MKELKERNIRSYIDLIQRMFDISESMLVKISLIEICIDQQLTDEFVINKDGLDVHFIPAACVLPQDSDGFESWPNEVSLGMGMTTDLRASFFDIFTIIPLSL